MFFADNKRVKTSGPSLSRAVGGGAGVAVGTAGGTGQSLNKLPVFFIAYK